MVQSSMDMGGDELEIRAKVVLSLEQAKRQLQELGGNLSGGAANLAGQAGAAMGIGTRGANADAEPTRTKEQDERAKVRTNALQTLAKQAPGGGLATSMAKSFSQGGMVSGIATGITAVVGILTSIMKSSQVFQTMAGTVFKILGMMADLFLMPFVPLMMKFAGWMIQHMPDVIKWGENTAKWVERLFNFFTGRWGQSLTDKGKEEGGIGGFFKRVAGAAFSKEGLMIAGGAAMIATGVAAPLGAGLIAAGGTGMVTKAAKGEYQMGGKVPGGPGAEVQATLHGGEIIVPQDIAAGAKGFGGRVASWIQRFQQKEMGPGGVMERWYDEMFGGSIMPDIWSNIHGFFGGIETETESINKRVGSDTGKLEEDRKSFWDKLKFWEYLPEIWGKVKDFFTGLGKKLKDFFTFDIPLIDLAASAALIGACFARAGGAVIGFFTNTLPNAARTAAAGIVTAAVWSWGGVSTVINIIGSAFSTAGRAVWHFFSSILPGWAVSAGQAIAGAAVWVWGGISWVAEKVWAGLKIAGEAIWKFFTEIVPNFARDAAGAIAGAAVWVWGGISLLATKIWAYIKIAADAVETFFTDTLPGWVWDAYLAVWGAIQKITSFVSGIAEKIGGWISLAFDEVKDFFTTTLPGWVFDAYLAIWGVVNGIASFVSGIADKIKDRVQWAVDEVKDFFTTTLPGWAYSAYVGVWSAITGITNPLGDIVGDIKNAAQNAINMVADFLRGLVEKMKPWNWFTGDDNQYGNTSSNSIYEFGNSVTSGGIHAFGGSGGGPRRVLGVGNMLSGNGGITSSRVVNVNITSSMSIHDIVRDVERLDSIQEAAFFNTV